MDPLNCISNSKFEYVGNYITQIPKRSEDTLKILQLEYSNLLLEGEFLKLKPSKDFLPTFTDFFGQLFDAYDPSHKWSHVNTPLFNEKYGTSNLQLSHENQDNMHLSTQPVMYVVYAGDVELLKKMDPFLSESTYNMRLCNGFNLMHCLIKGQCLSLIDPVPCAKFLLKKNIHLLKGLDDNGLTPLALAIATLKKIRENKNILTVNQPVMHPCLSSQTNYTNEIQNVFKAHNSNYLVYYYSELNALEKQIRGLTSIIKMLEKIMESDVKKESKTETLKETKITILSKSY